MTDKCSDKKDPGSMSDRELLVRLDERVGHIDIVVSNHLKHHWTIALAVITAFCAAVGALLVHLLIK